MPAPGSRFNRRSVVKERLNRGKADEHRSTEFAAALYELKRQLFAVPKEVLVKRMGSAWMSQTLELLNDMVRKVRDNGWRYYVAQHYQKKFHASTKRLRLVLGGNRSGKSVAGVWEAITFALGYNPYKPDFFIPMPQDVVICSKTSKTMKMYINDYVFQFLPRRQIKNIVRQKGDILDFVELNNGSRITFMSYDQGRERFQGFSANAVHFDEEPPEDIFHECMVRLIDTQGHAWLTMTPLLGLTWVYHDLYLNPDNDPEFEAYEWNMQDNACLAPGEVDRILSKFPDEVREARSGGKFLGMAGIVYPWLARDEAYSKPFAIPSHWQRVRVIDPSAAGVTACLWIAIDTQNNLWCYREYYARDRNVSEHCDWIRNLSGNEAYAMDIIDSAAMETNKEIGKTTYQLYVDHLYHHGARKNQLVLARKDITPGIETVWEYCRAAESYVAGAEPPHPYLRVFSDLVNFRAEARKYRWEERKTGAMQGERTNKPVHKNCHLLDALRYACHYGLVYVKRTPPGLTRDRRPDPVMGWKV
jgi:phage terminase large subunit-like protein